MARELEARTVNPETNEGWDYAETLGGEARGQCVLGYLSARYPRASEADWRERILRGEVTLDGQIAVAEQPLRPGGLLVWRRPPWVEPEVPLDFAVLYEDEHLLAVSKPSGLPCVPAGGFLEHTLLAQVRRRDPRWSPMHRLGRGTSGLVLFAGTHEARSRLQAAWRGDGVEKWYRALASGAMPGARFEVDAPIGPVEHPVLGTVFAASPSGRRAHSEVHPLAPREDGWVAAVRIATGRSHQIRIHLAWAGHPLVDDPLYGVGGLPRSAALPGDLGYSLHSWRLAFAHPITGRRLELEAPLPRRLVSP